MDNLYSPNLYRNGVGAVILNSKNLVLVGKRLDSPSSWQMPQGGVENDENGVTEDGSIAVLREIEEEVGIKSEKLKILGHTDLIRYDIPFPLISNIWGGKYKGQQQHWYFLQFLGSNGDINLNASDHPEFSDYKWVTVQDTIENAIDFKKDVYKKIFDYAKTNKILQ